MTPTNELRFVERWDVEGELSHVLQQKWVTYWSDDMGGGPRESEWRDVPLVEEKP